ncbi:Uncharacterised protein [Pseudomonas luteola]|uniref:Uncharacterized protein n=1 Tax=Pseudomonas luteola TaxID=47886 RepID=A0A2X2C6L0_PSELU|nr:hypothetical protein [Pseudomonas luteola]SPZ02541.1 Uncharacterised protein [Pseudomonas luteola]
MKNIQRKVVAEDLRKVGTTALAAGIVTIFVTNQKLLTACALITGAVLWLLGVFLTKEE